MNTYRTVYGQTIGRTKYRKYTSIVCPLCKIKRYIEKNTIQNKNFSGFCRPCFSKNRVGAKSSRWKGGKFIDTKGYIMVKMPNHALADKQGYVLEHRLIMSELVGVEYVLDMVVHHKDGDRQNNDPNNLEIITRSKHSSMHNRTPETTTRLKDEPNPTIECRCGCGRVRLKYDKRNRLREYINGHGRRNKTGVFV